MVYHMAEDVKKVYAVDENLMQSNDEMMQEDFNQLIRDIAEYEYKLFVVNNYAAGIQYDDGRYITKYIPMSPFVIENMLLQHGSMGCYQQGYKTGRIKWICFDFDCKDKMNPNIETLYQNYVLPFVQMLDEVGIRYLTEFSGRRGIHVWILFNMLLPKELGFRMVCELERRCPRLTGINESGEWGLDRFPATDSSWNNVVGKQVKFPLSCHRSGERSYFFAGIFCRKVDTYSSGFLQGQLDILQNYIANNVDEVAEKLGVVTGRIASGMLKYRKYRMIGRIEVTTDQVIDVLSETAVFEQIFRRMKLGLALPQDWTVLLGTLSLCDSSAQIVKSVFQRFPNYDEEKTYKNISKLVDKYFPATFGYLYRIYEMPMETEIDENETGLHYLLRRCGFEQHLLMPFEELNEKKAISDIRITVNKEKAYLKDNDEVADVSAWNQLCNLKQYDLQFYEELITKIVNGESVLLSPAEYRVYERKESAEKTRMLISLSTKERVITTHLAIRLCSVLKTSWKSFSYHISYLSQDNIFYYWYSPWGRFIDHIRVFIEIPFMQNFEVFYLDLKGFYDHIDFLTVYRTFEKVLDEEAKNIFIFLTEYNDKLMKELHNGRRIGVPQGPAYARIIAEMFLDRLLENVYVRYDRSNFYVYRYVDDIVIFCNPNMDGKTLFEDLKDSLFSYGLPANLEKSRYFGKISTLSEEDKRILLHKDSFNYELQENDYTGTLFGRERRKNLQNYLTNNQFRMESLGYIFGKNTIAEARVWCLENYRRDILKSHEGRGKNFRRFYYFLFQNKPYMDKVLDEKELFLIPTESLNFSNFIHTLYFTVQDRMIAPEIFERVKEEYLVLLQDRQMNERDSSILNALIMIKVEVLNEKD